MQREGTREASPIICYVTDRRSLPLQPGENAVQVLLGRIQTAIAAGANWIQIREKDLDAAELLPLARGAIDIVKPAAALVERPNAARILVRILVNDRADVAWAADAAGVHLGENSIPVSALAGERAASRRTGFLIGASCHSMEAAVSAARDGADYIFFGPIFATPSKERFGTPQGLSRLGEVRAAVNIPVIAIGGITAENAASCLDAGAAGFAAIRLFQESKDAKDLAKALNAAISR